MEDVLARIERARGTPFETNRRRAIGAILETIRTEAGDDAVAAVADWMGGYEDLELSAIRGYAVDRHGVPLAAFPDEAYPDP